MATKTYAGLKDILITKLTALLGVDSNALFVQVVGSNITDPDGYPICYVVEQKGSGKIIDTARNERMWEFSVVIHYALSGRSEADVNTSLLDAVDRVVTMFDQDPMLATDEGEAQCSRVEVTPVLVERAVQDVPIVRALITVDVYDLVARYAS